MSNIEQVTASFVAGARLLSAQVAGARANRELAHARLDALGATPGMLDALAQLVTVGYTEAEVRKLAVEYSRGPLAAADIERLAADRESADTETGR